MSKDLKHIAIVMDGNGRWAKQRGLARTAGHSEGLKTVKKIVKAISDMQIPFVTLYTFLLKTGSEPNKRLAFLCH